MTQRMIQDTFWTDSYIENLDPSEKLLFIYLLTNPLCNIAGIYEIQTKRIAYETGFDKEMVDKILKRFEKDGKILRSGSWLLIVNHAKHQAYKNPNVTTGIRRIVEDLPDKVKALKGFERLSHFTLLNLTLPNSTKHNACDVSSPPKKQFDPLGAEIIKAFESVDAKNKNYYGNKTQRASCDFLLDEYGLEETLARIAALTKTNTMRYFPTITTPHQLQEKWKQLEIALIRSKEESNSHTIL